MSDLPDLSEPRYGFLRGLNTCLEYSAVIGILVGLAVPPLLLFLQSMTIVSAVILCVECLSGSMFLFFIAGLVSVLMDIEENGRRLLFAVTSSPKASAPPPRRSKSNDPDDLPI